MKKKLVLYSLISLLLSSCFIVNHSAIVKRTDEVKNIQTVSFKLFNLHSKERKSPLSGNTKHFYKKINSENKSSYFIYETLLLKYTSSPINDTIYLIIDETIFPIIIDEKQIFGKTIKTPQTDNILTADSSTVTVITGYDETNLMAEKIKYQLRDKEIDAIKIAKNLKFRYYSEPEMITIEINCLNLKRIKHFISTN